ncbi:MAG TPA: hypothetical protein VIN08_00275 [Ohtaekwangia sp.]|uniref:hypothetical protein n=1 Tax=Ohtaekwangia sp. TaxID=2066019 RepID=UPI002F94ADD2
MKLLTALTLNLITYTTSFAQGNFNWTDTLLTVGQTRTIHLSRAFDGPCTTKPCYTYYQNQNTYDTLLSFLNSNENVSVVFLWHTWTEDCYAYNFHVSQKMAQGLINELIKHGIGEKRIAAVGLGEARPLISVAELNKIDPTKRFSVDRKNSRIEMIIVSVKEFN